jgi:hypothetical protein
MLPSSSSSSSSSSTLHENKLCSYCGEVKPLVQERNVYYNRGKSMRVIYLCREYGIASRVKGCCCYDNYRSDVVNSLGLTVAGFYNKAYVTILSVFISSPIVSGNLNTKISGGHHSITLIAALKIAYSLSYEVRIELGASGIIERGKDPPAEDYDNNKSLFSLDNPRVWPYVWQMRHAEPRLELVSEDPLTFRWRRE